MSISDEFLNQIKSQPESNIKARFTLYNGKDNPIVSIQEYNQLRAGLYPDNKSFKIDDTFVDSNGEKFEVENIYLEVLENEISAHIGIGADWALTGNAFPYNLLVNVILKRIIF